MKLGLGIALNRGAFVGGLDPDAKAYIAAVEAADTQALEKGVKAAYNTFIVGLKNDGIWDKIVGACILAGARTLAGALVPLKGTAPTNVSNNFVSGDYNRETGLLGNGTTKYLDTNIATSSVPEDTNHAAIEIHTAPPTNGIYLGIIPTDLTLARSGSDFRIRNYNSGSNTISLASGQLSTGFAGMSRSSNTRTDARINGTDLTPNTSQTSGTPASGNIFVFAVNNTATPAAANFVAARLRFYSLGDSLGSGATGLTNFNNRVDSLMTDLAAAIP